MAIFAKGRTSSGLGRGVADVDGGDVMERPSVGASEAVVDNIAPPSEAGRIMPEVTAKPSRAERRAAANAAKLNATASSSLVTGAKADKSAKLTRAQRKAEKDAAEAASDALRPSNKVMIDFYPGIAKEDAIETARNWAMTNMDLPSMCFYYVHKTQDGWAIEVQEGVGKAYLPSAINLAQASPGRLVVVPMIRRKMTIYYSARLGEFESQVLPELQEPPHMPENPPIEAKRGPVMTPVMKQYREWLVSGAVTAAIGGLALLSSLAFYALDPKAKVPPEWRTTDVAQLPIMQWSRLQASSTDSYVVRLEFQDGQWRIVRQAVGASVDVAPPSAPALSAPIVGGPALSPNGAAPPGVQANVSPTAAQAGPPAPASNGSAVSIPPPSN